MGFQFCLNYIMGQTQLSMSTFRRVLLLYNQNQSKASDPWSLSKSQKSPASVDSLYKETKHLCGFKNQVDDLVHTVLIPLIHCLAISFYRSCMIIGNLIPILVFNFEKRGLSYQYDTNLFARKKVND